MSSSENRGGGIAGLLVALALLGGMVFLIPSGPEKADAAGFRPMSAPADPVRLVVPALEIKAPVKEIEVNDKQILDPPRNPREVGWWKRSAPPGATRGQTVLTGHTVNTGGGVMDDLGKLRRGQKVKVVTSKETMHYRVTRVVTYSKKELAERAVELFAQKRTDVRLVLITCTGWTGKDYTGNIVAFAEPLGVRENAS